MIIRFSRIRLTIAVPLAALAFAQILVMVSWAGRWGFFGGIIHWFETFQDPISLAAGIDLLALMVIIFIWMVMREGRWTKALGVSLIPFIVFPSVGLLLYLMISERALPGETSQGQ